MLWQHAGSLLRSLLCPRPNIICGASHVTGVLWTLAPLISMSWFNFIELDEEEEEASRNNAMLVRRVLNFTYRSAARSWESRSSSGGSWMLFPAAGEHATSADGSSGSVTLCVSSSSSSRNYWSAEVCEGERSEGDAPATLGAQGSGRSTTSTPKGTKERPHLCERSLTKEVKLRQHLRRELEQSPVEPAAVTFSGTIGTVELTESELLVSPPRPRARSTPPLRGPTWQQGGEADLAATTARRQLKKDLGEQNADRQGARVAPAQNLPWAPRHGRRGLSAAATW